MADRDADAVKRIKEAGVQMIELTPQAAISSSSFHESARAVLGQSRKGLPAATLRRDRAGHQVRCEGGGWGRGGVTARRSRIGLWTYDRG